jgi:hypothetical protein
VEPDEQLEWERRAGRPAGIAAIIAGTLLIFASILGGRAAGDDLFETYQNISDDPSLILAPNIVQAIAYLLAGYAIWYLVRATVPRRTELANANRILAILGTVATAISLVITAFAVLEVADKVAEVARPPRTEDARDDLIEDLQRDSGLITTATIITYTARLALGFALVLASMSAMRAGLLSRFTGILGVIAGVLAALFGGPAFFLLAFWLAALGLIFIDRWPSGRGTAWGEVAAIPWPSAMDQQRAAMDAKEGDEEYAEDEDEAYEEEEAEPGEPEHEPHPASKKRKKKKRRR